LAWLCRGATTATVEALKAGVVKLAFLPLHGPTALTLSAVTAGRRRSLAEIGRRSLPSRGVPRALDRPE